MVIINVGNYYSVCFEFPD